MKKIAFLLIFLFSFNSFSETTDEQGSPLSTTFDGNDLLPKAEAMIAIDKNFENSSLQDKADSVYFMGYFNAAIDVSSIIAATRNHRNYCINNNVSMKQMAVIAAKYIVDNPQIRHYPSFILIMNSLEKAFPCNNSNK